MPYWEMLGRAVVTLASKSVSEEISEYLTYSGLDATVSYDQDTATPLMPDEDFVQEQTELWDAMQEETVNEAVG